MTEQPMRLSQFGYPQRDPRRQRLIIGGSLAAVALLIAAITAGVLFGDDTTNTGAAASVPTSASTQTSVSQPPRRFDTPQALVTYLDSRGLTCSRYEPVEGATAAIARGSCYVGTDEVTIGVYAIHSDVEAQWTMMSGMLSGILSMYMALGENWTVNGPAEWTRKVADVMGVEYRQQVS